MSFPDLSLCLASLYRSYSPFVVSSLSYKSSYAFLLALATTLLAFILHFLFFFLLASSCLMSQAFMAFFFSLMFSCSSSFHHQVSFPFFFLPDDITKTFSAAFLIISTVVSQCSGSSSFPCRPFVISSLNRS